MLVAPIGNSNLGAHNSSAILCLLCLKYFRGLQSKNATTKATQNSTDNEIDLRNTKCSTKRNTLPHHTTPHHHHHHHTTPTPPPTTTRSDPMKHIFKSIVERRMESISNQMQCKMMPTNECAGCQR